MANDKNLRLLAYIVGGPAYDLPLAYCAGGNQHDNMRAAFQSGAMYYGAMGSVLTLAGLVPTPATPFFIVLGPLCLAVAGVFKSLGDGRSIGAGDVAGIAQAGAPALAAVGGDPTGGKAADLAGAFAGLAEFAEASGLVSALPSFVPSAGSRTARDAKKNALKQLKAKAKQMALLKAHNSSRHRLEDCTARGGVFDPSAPDGCRVGPPSKTKVGGAASGAKGLGIAAVVVGALKVFGAF